MATGDGNGWVECRCGHRHWGRFGAAGLVLARPAARSARSAVRPEVSPEVRPEVLMQLRAAWTHEGGRWGVPGGARDSHESLAEAAIREAGEEAGIDPGLVQVAGTATGADHGSWSYTYVIATAEPGLVVGPANAESEALAWVSLDGVPDLPLHSGLAQAWESLRPLVISALDAAG